LKDRRIEILGILVMTISLLVLISLIGHNPNEDPGISPNVNVENPLGILGVYISYFFIKFLFGFPSFGLPVLGIIWGWLCFGHKDLKPFNRVAGYVIGAIVLISSTIGLLEIGLESKSGLNFTYSGFVGGNLANILFSFLGIIGTTILLIALWLMLIRGYFEFSFYHQLEKVSLFFKKKWNHYRSKKELAKTEKAKRKHTHDLLEKIDAHQQSEEKALEIKSEEATPQTNESSIKRPISEEDTARSDELLGPIVDEKDHISQKDSKSFPDSLEDEGQPEADHQFEVGEMVQEEEVRLDEVAERNQPKRKYQLPSSDILATPVNISDGMSRDELVDRAEFLTQSLLTFGVRGKVVNVSPGPVITLF